MADQSVRGQFVWHELKTPDANAAHAFYAKAIGWKSQPWEEDSSYVMFAAARGPIGATAAPGDDRQDAPPHWLPYIGTGDIEKTVEQAQKLGGSVAKDIDSLSTGSRYAVLTDPFGASFGVYESAEDYGTMTPPQTGEHSWHELMTGDYRAAFDFYSSLFGWQKMDEYDMGELGTYMIWGLDGRKLGGMFNAMNGGPPPSWLSYVQVKDVHQLARKVKSAGGTVLNGPMEVPGGDWIVQVADPQGAMFAGHATAARALEAPKKQKKVKAAAAETPAPVTEDDETPTAEDAPPAEKAPEEKAPAKRAPRKKAPAQEAPAKEAPPAEESPVEEAPPAQEAPAKKAPAKKAPSKKAPAKKKSPPPAKKSSKMPAKKKAGKKAGKKKAPASKGAGAKKSAKKGSKKVKTRSGGSKKAAKTPRKKK